jgi:asparagine synthase (glutamine-hydrolysing)
LTLEDGRVSLSCYWDLPALADEPLTMHDDEAAGHLLALLEDAVRLRLRSDVPLGVNLSGGLDSASLMFTADRLLQDVGEVQTFTASFADSHYDEQEFAAEVPRNTHWVRHIQRLDEKNVWDVAWQALEHQEAPYGGIATMAYHHLHRLARDCGITVLLEGQGVDEMLAGYNYFRPFYYLDLLKHRRWSELRREVRLDLANGHLGLTAVRCLRTGAAVNVYQDGTSHLQPHCVLPDVRALAGGPPAFAQPFRDHLTNALYRDLRYTKLPRVLRMNDRLSMAFSRELREPYLDHRVVEFLFRLPGHQKIRLGQSKYLLRHAMAGRLPDAVRLREKRGVVTPQREWLRTVLRPQVEEIIHSHSFAQRGLFDVARVKTSYERFCHGEGENAFFVWQWVNTELWFRCFVDCASRWAEI